MALRRVNFPYLQVLSTEYLATRFRQPLRWLGNSVFPLHGASNMSRLLFLLVAAFAALCSFLPAAESGKPNILFIVGDDMGYADVGFHGCQDIPTPNLDALAKASVRCTNGYVSG